MHTKLEHQIRSGIVFKLMNNLQHISMTQYTFYTTERYIWNPVSNIAHDTIVNNIKPNRPPYNVNKQSILNSLLKTGFIK